MNVWVLIKPVPASSRQSGLASFKLPKSRFRPKPRATCFLSGSGMPTGRALTPEEAAEFDSYIHVANLLTVMHAEARTALRQPDAGGS